jgi:predicted nucleic-acid-binding Zn-ribbon protein
MTVSKCPNCGSLEMYRSRRTTAARGLLGPNLLPGLSAARGRFRVVVCRDCGLTRLFAGVMDRDALGSSQAWERVSDAKGPLGLDVR